MYLGCFNDLEIYLIDLNWFTIVGVVNWGHWLFVWQEKLFYVWQGKLSFNFQLRCEKLGCLLHKTCVLTLVVAANQVRLAFQLHDYHLLLGQLPLSQQVVYLNCQLLIAVCESQVVYVYSLTFQLLKLHSFQLFTTNQPLQCPLHFSKQVNHTNKLQQCYYLHLMNNQIRVLDLVQQPCQELHFGVFLLLSQSHQLIYWILLILSKQKSLSHCWWVALLSGFVDEKGVFMSHLMMNNPSAMNYNFVRCLNHLHFAFLFANQFGCSMAIVKLTQLHGLRLQSYQVHSFAEQFDLLVSGRLSCCFYCFRYWGFKKKLHHSIRRLLPKSEP